MNFYFFHCFIVLTIQDFCGLSPIQFTPPNAVKLSRFVVGVNQA